MEENDRTVTLLDMVVETQPKESDGSAIFPCGKQLQLLLPLLQFTVFDLCIEGMDNTIQRCDGWERFGT